MSGFISIPMAKLALSAVASVSVGKVIGEIVKNNVNVVTKMDKALVWTGTWIISGVIAEQATKHADVAVDSAVLVYKNLKEEIDKNDDVALDVDIDDIDEESPDADRA